MFGIGKGKKEELVGATAKLQNARLIKDAGGNYVIESKREGKEPAPIIPIVFIYSLSVVLAFFLSDSLYKEHTIRLTGDTQLDRILFGSSLPSLMGDPDMDKILVMFIRGAFIAAVAGIMPFLTYVFVRITDNIRVNLYLAFWGVTVGSTTIFYLMRDSLIPLIQEIIGFAA